MTPDPILLPGDIPGLLQTGATCVVLGDGPNQDEPVEMTALGGQRGIPVVNPGGRVLVIAPDTVTRGGAADPDDRSPAATVGLRSGWALCPLRLLALDLRAPLGADVAARWLAGRLGITSGTTCPQWRWDDYRDLWSLGGKVQRGYFGPSGDESGVRANDGATEVGPGRIVPTLADIAKSDDQSLLALRAVCLHVAGRP